MKTNKFIKNPYTLKFPPFIIGLIFLIIGIVTYFNLIQKIDAINTIFSTIFMISGVLEILYSIQNKKNISNWKWSFSFGLSTYIIGILLISEPLVTRDIISFYIGIYFIFRAIFSINFGIDIFRKNHRSAYTVISLSFVLIILGTTLVWLPQQIHNYVPFLDGTSFLITGYLIFYIYNTFRKSKKINYQPQLN